MPIRPPHDPSERELVAQLGSWQVRRFALRSIKHTYFAPRGFLHLQLWHPEARVSVITPSRVTGGQFEVEDGDRAALPTWEAVRVYLGDSLALPGDAALRALDRWFVAPHEPAQIRLLRAWWSVPAQRRAEP